MPGLVFTNVALPVCVLLGPHALQISFSVPPAPHCFPINKLIITFCSIMFFCTCMSTYKYTSTPDEQTHRLGGGGGALRFGPRLEWESCFGTGTLTGGGTTGLPANGWNLRPMGLGGGRGGGSFDPAERDGSGQSCTVVAALRRGLDLYNTQYTLHGK